jgi:hypothetical protein
MSNGKPQSTFFKTDVVPCRRPCTFDREIYMIYMIPHPSVWVMFNISFHFGMEYVCMLFFLLILILVLCIANFENTKIFWLPSTPRVFTSPFVLYVSNPERYLLLVQLRASKWSGDRRNSEISLTGAKIPRSFIFKIDILFVCFSGLFFMGRFLYIIFFVCVWCCGEFV